MTANVLAQVISRYWLAATDDISVEMIDAAGSEAAYRLGFVNALQYMFQAAAGAEMDEVLAAGREAVALLEADAPQEPAND